MKKKISIIIPHYNACDKLVRLLDSIPTDSDIEVIVVDDRSTGCENELKELKEEYPYVIFLCNNDGNKGAGTCRNIGMNHAKGDWIIFADSDDFFLNEFLEKIRVYFDSIYDVIFFTPTSYDELRRDESDRHIPFEIIIDNYIKNEKEYVQDLRYKFFVPWSKMIKRNFILEKNILFDEIIAANDVMFSTKIGHEMIKFKADRNPIYCVTKNIGTLTMIPNQDVFLSRVQVHIRYRTFLKKNISNEEFKKLNIDSRYYLLRAINLKLGIFFVFKICFLFIINKIPFLYLDKYSKSKFSAYKKNLKNERNYHEKS